MTASIHWRENRIVQDRIKKSIAYTIVIIMAVAYIFPLYWLIVTALKTDVEIFQQPPPIFPPNPQWQNFGESTTYIPFLALYVEYDCHLRLDGAGHRAVLHLSSLMASRAFAGPGAISSSSFILSNHHAAIAGDADSAVSDISRSGLGGHILAAGRAAFLRQRALRILLRQFLLTIPLELSDAAKIDGASELGICGTS